jgi:hypothetical protein
MKPATGACIAGAAEEELPVAVGLEEPPDFDPELPDFDPAEEPPEEPVADAEAPEL